MLLALLAATAHPSQTPALFVRQLYANYRRANFSPFEHPERIFSPRLLKAIKADSRLAHGEVGYLDGDPICQCQDAAGMRAKILSATQQSPGTAIVRVSIGWERDRPRSIKLTLVRTAEGWHIADIGSPGEPSLVAALEASNRKVQASRP